MGKGGDLAIDIDDGMAGEGALVVALAQEVSKDDGAEEGVLEGDGAEDDPDEDEDFGVGDDGHGSVIVG